jgi:hypothetical protein
MALVGHISGSTQTSSKIGITGSVIVANRPNASFPTLPSDVTFYVSGSSGSTEKSLFGGDLVISGSAKAQLGLSGSLTKLFDGSSYLVAGSNVTIASSSNGQVTISSAGGSGSPGGSDDQIQYNDAGSFGASSNFTYNGSTVHLTGSFSQGDNTLVYDGTYGHAEGINSVAQGNYSHAEGFSTEARGHYSHAEGVITIAIGQGAHSEGNDNTASGSFSHTEGETTFTYGYASHAEGVGSITKGEGLGSHAEGYYTITSASYSHAEGFQTITSGSYSHAEGRSTIARGPYSHAEGRLTLASANYSHAEGESTTASGAASHSEGFLTIASQASAHAEGEFTIASGGGSHAEGGTTSATATYSHAEGEFTTAKGLGSHAEGNETTTVGIYSHAEGFRTIASGSYQHVQGKYNTRNNNFSLFVVGNGTGPGDASRSDVFRINSGILGNGRVEVTGSFVSTIGLSGSLTNLSDGTSYLVAGSNITISSASNGAITISSTGGGGGGSTDDFFDSTTAGSIFTTGSAAFRGAESISSPADKGSDVFFYVSGSKGAVSNEKSLFGGDLVVSGSLFSQGDRLEVTGTILATQGISGSLTQLTDGTSYLIAGTNISITSQSNGAVTISNTFQQVDDFFDSTTAGSIFTTGSAAFRGAESIDSPSDKGADVFFYVSGSNGNDRSLFGGDVVVSGSFFAQGDSLEMTGSILATSGFSGSLTKLTDGTSYLIAGSNVTITSASNGAITISSTGGGGGGVTDDFFDSTTAGSIFTTGSTAFRGAEAAIDSPLDKGTDVFFYVSGSTAAARGNVSLFGGYVWISGSLVQGNFGASGGATGQYARAHGERTTASGASSHSEGRFSLAQGANSHAEGDSTVTYAAGSHAEGLDSAAFAAYSHAEGRSTEARGLYSHAEGYDTIPRADYSHAEGRDTQVLTAGLYGHAEGSGSIAIGEASHAEGLGTLASGSYQLAVGKYNTRDNTSSLFVVGNGTSDSAANRSDIFRVEQSSVQVTGSFVSTLGLSGSLTKLANGSSYLVAGSNVTITSASNGSVTISSTGGGGGGSNYLRFLAGTVTSTAASGSMESIGMDYLSSGLVGATTYTFEVILATTAGTTAYMDLYDYSGVINGTPGPIAGSVLTGSSQSYTYLSANVTSQFSLASGPGIIEARVWCTPNGSGLSAICKNAKLKVE